MRSFEEWTSDMEKKVETKIKEKRKERKFENKVRLKRTSAFSNPFVPPRQKAGGYVIIRSATPHKKQINQ